MPSSTSSSPLRRSQTPTPSRRSRLRSRATIFVIGFLFGIVAVNTRISPQSRHFDGAVGRAVGTVSGSSNVQQQQRQRHPERIYFAHQPTRFITEFARCAKAKRCKLLYWHIQKTGGTYLASRLYKILNRDVGGYKSKEWCCHESFMKRKFRTNVTKYCATNFGVYEVRPNQYREIVDTCLRQQQQQQQQEDLHDEELEYVGLMTIREPLQRTISQIHQQCNVHRSHLKSNEQEICNRCTYDDNQERYDDDGGIDDRSFYDHIANATNTIYQEMKDMVEVESDHHDDDDENDPSTVETDEDVVVRGRRNKKEKYLDIPLLILNNDDMDDFFDGLEKHVTNILSNKNPTAATRPSLSMLPKVAAGTGANDDDDDDEDDEFDNDGPYHLPRGRTNAQKLEVVTGKNENRTTTESTEEKKQQSDPKLCNFAMPSQLMKLHRPSLDVYRWFQRQQ